MIQFQSFPCFTFLVETPSGSGVSFWQAGIDRRKPADRRPVEIFAAMGEETEKTVMQKTREWHRYPQFVCCLKNQADVFLAQWRSEAGWRKTPAGDETAI